ncbi:hypothetical protein NDA15_005141 [Ustilago hordei]|nr:hypothetical protein NDA15_005141 [Ustilago hordei]
MPTITFVTPPGRPSVLRAHTIQPALPQDDQPQASTSKLPSQTMPVPTTNKEDERSKPTPLVFQKRILPQLTTSPEPAQESFGTPQPRPRVSLDESRSPTGEKKKPSLLSTAISGSSRLPPRSASTTNLGILRRAELDDAHSSSTELPRPRLHFVEPHKQAAPVMSAKPEPTAEQQSTSSTQAASEQPRKRSLVIQEHADVLERAAERAARNNLSTQALEQHGRSRQHCTSSGGEETASTRSSWALRSSSRGSSIATSPTYASERSDEGRIRSDRLRRSLRLCRWGRIGISGERMWMRKALDIVRMKRIVMRRRMRRMRRVVRGGKSDIQSLQQSDEEEDAVDMQLTGQDLRSTSTAPNDVKLAPNQRRASTPGLTITNTAFSTQRSPPRTQIQSPRSTQTSPLSAPSTRKLKPKEFFSSHPMCFLPDAFEDSAPPTPTEPDSEGYEPPRVTLLSGWLSEGGGGGGSGASSRRTSWQHPHPNPSLRSPVGEEGLAMPITLPPFRRTRERTPQYGVTSDGEQSSRSLGGNVAFIRESAGFGRSPNWGASPSQHLGISVPINPNPTQHDRPSTALAGYRRASHSVEPQRKVNSAFTSPIGSYSHQQPGRRPGMGKQRPVSTCSHIRSFASVKTSMNGDVVMATSPPREAGSALECLKHQLEAHSPKCRSGRTTPGWLSDGPGLGAGKYRSERLSSLAQAMSVGGAKATGFVDGDGGEAHRRSKSVPLQIAPSPVPPVEVEGTLELVKPTPIAITPTTANSETTANNKWTAERDGETLPPPPSSTKKGDEEEEEEEEEKPFQFAKQELGEDGKLRMVVIHTSSERKA